MSGEPRRSAREPRLGLIVAGNLLGAMVASFYFRHIDPRAAELGAGAARDLPFFVVGFAAVATVAYRAGRRWSRPLFHAGNPPSALERRRALLLPYVLAGISFMAWVAAGALWGVVWPLVTGTFSPSRAGRLAFGITGIGGVVTTAFIFLIVEHRWRAMLPRFFPDGDLSSVRGVVRLPVRLRLMLVFLLVGVVPLSVLGVLAYTRSVALLHVDPAEAEAMVGATLPVIAFILAVGVAAAVGLSIFVARSVAVPLSTVEAAMAEVGRGKLDSRCPVLSNDEIGAVAEGFNRMLEGLREREFVKETFGKYVTREIRDEILAGRILLGGEAVEVTILFADLRDFTPWVEATPPTEVVSELNAYFTEMEAAIRAHGGLVLQYIGDEIEAVFGAPVHREDHRDCAVRAALEMRGRLAAWNTARAALGKPPLRHGIGIHTGTVLAGNIGSADRLSYALVGDPVNLAARIQDLTKTLGGDILVSAATRQRLVAPIELRPLPAVAVKGKSGTVEVFQVP